MWVLEITDDPADRVSFRMPVGAVKTIGRSAGAEFIVDSALVSRLHCQLSSIGDTLRVKDLESTNGTFVNGRRIASAELRDGDCLRVGRVELRVSRRTEQPAAERLPPH
jgi:pSer/pThr/pTyr-binding forkhead associated (FHA) protein